MFFEPLIIVDVETTGGNPRTDRIIEVGAIRVEHNKVVAKFKSLINPEQSIPTFITKITGIQNSDVSAAPYFYEIIPQLSSLFSGATFVAHNVNFDYGFIGTEFNRVHVPFTMPRLCTVRLSRALYPQFPRHNLSEIIERFSLECQQRHRALDDAMVLWDFLQITSQSFPLEHIQKVISDIIA